MQGLVQNFEGAYRTIFFRGWASSKSSKKTNLPGLLKPERLAFCSPWACLPFTRAILFSFVFPFCWDGLVSELGFCGEMGLFKESLIGLLTSYASWWDFEERPTSETTSIASMPKPTAPFLSRERSSDWESLNFETSLFFSGKSAAWDRELSFLSGFWGFTESLFWWFIWTSEDAPGLEVESDGFVIVGADLPLERPDCSSSKLQLFKDFGLSTLLF